MSRLSRKWKRSSLDSVAVYIRTGTLTRPNEIVPLQIERGGTTTSYPVGQRFQPARATVENPVEYVDSCIERLQRSHRRVQAHRPELPPALAPQLVARNEA